MRTGSVTSGPDNILLLLHLTSILSRDRVTIEWILIDNRIYWTFTLVTTNNYVSLTELHATKITVTTTHIKSSQSSLAVAWQRLQRRTFHFLWIPVLSSASATRFSLLTTATLNQLNWLNHNSVGRLNCCWFSSAVISGFSLLEIHDQDFYSLLDIYVFRNGASSAAKEGRSFYVGFMFDVPQFQHKYIRAVTGSRSGWVLCILCHCIITT
jgi:hypothetical protein